MLAGWIVVLALAAVAGTTLKGTFTADYSTPGSDSEAAGERMEQAFAGRSGEAVDVVWSAERGATAPAVTGRTDRVLGEAGTLPGIVPGTTAAAPTAS